MPIYDTIANLFTIQGPSVMLAGVSSAAAASGDVSINTCAKKPVNSFTRVLSLRRSLKRSASPCCQARKARSPCAAKSPCARRSRSRKVLTPSPCRQNSFCGLSRSPCGANKSCRRSSRKSRSARKSLRLSLRKSLLGGKARKSRSARKSSRKSAKRSGCNSCASQRRSRRVGKCLSSRRSFNRRYLPASVKRSMRRAARGCRSVKVCRYPLFGTQLAYGCVFVGLPLQDCRPRRPRLLCPRRRPRDAQASGPAPRWPHVPQGCPQGRQGPRRCPRQEGLNRVFLQ
jgi:hypothetical protein